MKTYQQFLKQELKAGNHDVAAAIDYLDIVLDEVERAAVLYSEQNRLKTIDDIIEKLRGVEEKRDFYTNYSIDDLIHIIDSMK